MNRDERISFMAGSVALLAVFYGMAVAASLLKAMETRGFGRG